MSERCPTCGCPVNVISGDEGTSYYEPLLGKPATWAQVRWQHEDVPTDRLIEIIRAIDTLGFVNMQFSAQTEEGDTWTVTFDTGGDVVGEEQ